MVINQKCTATYVGATGIIILSKNNRLSAGSISLRRARGTGHNLY
ncbi:hypothetical protein PSHT_06689 [Puccinia striiformis]|nr:hypothetical protein PSTT_04874 [Puccinia striiformis]POW16783.1 hypothetical protein PSHT_06689 [Puccinia striiformis]